MGRPTRLTKKVREKIYEGIRLGLSYDRAAQFAGVHPRTFYLWKEKGRKRKAPLYVQFLQELKEAEVEGEAAALKKIAAAADEGTWQAAAWLLERRFPDRWARVQKLDVTWQSKVINLVETGVLTIDEVREELGDELVVELFGTERVSIGEN